MHFSQLIMASMRPKHFVYYKLYYSYPSDKVQCDHILTLTVHLLPFPPTLPIVILPMTARGARVLTSEFMFFTSESTIPSSSQCFSSVINRTSGEENSENFLNNCSFCCKDQDPIFCWITLPLIFYTSTQWCLCQVDREIDEEEDFCALL